MSSSETLRDVFQETGWQQDRDERGRWPEGRRGKCQILSGQAEFLTASAR